MILAVSSPLEYLPQGKKKRHYKESGYQRSRNLENLFLSLEEPIVSEAYFLGKEFSPHPPPLFLKNRSHDTVTTEVTGPRCRFSVFHQTLPLFVRVVFCTVNWQVRDGGWADGSWKYLAVLLPSPPGTGAAFTYPKTGLKDLNLFIKVPKFSRAAVGGGGEPWSRSGAWLGSSLLFPINFVNRR